jgi:glycyl-tRNA synthetase alpha subunit
MGSLLFCMLSNKESSLKHEINEKINKIQSKFTAEIALINARFEIFVAETQGILDRINNIEQAVYDLYEEKRRYEGSNRVNQK